MVIIRMTICILTVVPIVSTAQQHDMNQFIALKYLVVLDDDNPPMNENIVPRYLWLDDYRLVIPLREVTGEQQGKDVLDIDVTEGTAMKIVSYEGISGLRLAQSQRGDVFFLSRSFYRDTGLPSPNDVEEVYESDVVDIASLKVSPTSRERYFQQRIIMSHDTIEEYPDSLLYNDSNDIYDSWGTPSHYWGEWGDYVVALGSIVEELSYNALCDIRLYNSKGSTVYVLPHISVFVTDAMHRIEHHLQVSREGSFFFIREIDKGYALQEIKLPFLRYGYQIISIYGFTDEDPTEYYDTVIYLMDGEEFGKNYAVGELFQVNQETIESSALATGPISASP